MAAMTGMNAATMMAAKRAREMAAARAQGAPTAGMTPMAPANQQPSTQRGTIGTMGGTIGGMASGLIGGGKNKANLRDLMNARRANKTAQPAGAASRNEAINRAMRGGATRAGVTQDKRAAGNSLMRNIGRAAANIRAGLI